MNSDPLTILAGRLRLLAITGFSATSDGELLKRYVTTSDEAAFAEIVCRHERTVLSACRQVLRNNADVEDVFQATFLALVQQAKRLNHDRSIDGWLFAVAHRIAVRVVRTQLRQSRRDAKAIPSTNPDIEIGAELSWCEASTALHEEVDALPDHFRLPIILHHLDGLGRDEVAARLGWRTSAVKDRLERGRERLRSALSRRGFTLSVMILVPFAGPNSTAVASPALIAGTIGAAGGNSSASIIKLARSSMPIFPLTTKLVFGGLIAATLGVGLRVTGLTSLGAWPVNAEARREQPPVKDAKLPPPPVEEKKAEVKQPQEKKVEVIIIQVTLAWTLRCAPDGSGWLTYGAGTSSGFKVGTFDFEATVKELRRITTKEQPKGGCFGVMLREKGVAPVYVFTADEKFILGLFAKGAAKENTENRSPEFDQAWKDHPPQMKRGFGGFGGQGGGGPRGQGGGGRD